MSVIKQISVYDGSSWNTNDIGAAASNISLSTNAAGASNVQTALNNLVGTSQLTGSKAIITNASGVLTASTVTSDQLGYLSGTTANLQTQINTLNTNLDNRIENTAKIRGTRIASIGKNTTKAYVKAASIGTAYGNALVSNNTHLWFVMFNPTSPSIHDLVGTGGTISYDSNTLTFTITAPYAGQMAVLAVGGIGISGTITFDE